MRKSALYAFCGVVGLLVVLGLIVLCSASQPNAYKFYHGNLFAYFVRQVIYVTVGIPIVVAVAKIDYHIWKNHRVLTWMLYGGVFLLLVAVLVPSIGRCVNGSYRWIQLGPVNLQPSELAKLAIVIVVAAWMDQLGWKSDRFLPGVAVPVLLIGGFAGPILAETDLGSAMVVCSAGFLMMLLGGTRWLYILGATALGACAGLGVLIATPNRVRRLLPWLRSALPQPVLDWLGIEQAAPVVAQKVSQMDPTTYQAYNSLVAIKNGAIWGVGPGQSMQKHHYLPEAHTDFVMAIGAEEYGIFFSVAVIVFFFAFFALSVYIGMKASDRYGRYLAFGAGFVIFFQAMFNLGVICEALPTKGMALPFFSYGGTNMIAASIAVGMILSVGIHSYQDKKRTLRNNVYFRD